jgi:hypothetical protein
VFGNLGPQWQSYDGERGGVEQRQGQVLGAREGASRSKAAAHPHGLRRHPAAQSCSDEVVMAVHGGGRARVGLLHEERIGYGVLGPPTGGLIDGGELVGSTRASGQGRRCSPVGLVGKGLGAVASQCRRGEAMPCRAAALV